jgi:tRNA nucleotidyltransferase (CCA-adding enzyme)
MSEAVNLAERLEWQLPADLNEFVEKAGIIAHERQQRLYLVGGTVRDLLLERPNLDLDLVVEGDAIKLAGEIAPVFKAEVTRHPRFGTASLHWGKRRADIATARAETYARPGALPRVRPGTIGDDLARRDFTVNAMAVALSPRRYGELADPHAGQKDLGKGLIRVLHERSFRDDATRIWRAVRYEQRLDFRIEPATLALLEKGLTRLKTVGGNRIRRELELILGEEAPEKTLTRAGELGVLARLHPSLAGDEWLAETFARARESCQPDLPHPSLYLALLCYRLTAAETEKLIDYLHLPAATAQVLRDTLAIKEKAGELSEPGLPPSRVYRRLHGLGLTALTAAQLATGSPTAAEHIELYLSVLRHVNPVLGGEDLKRLGVPEGPRIKEVLQALREARLDGRIDSREEEEAMVRGFLGE